MTFALLLPLLAQAAVATDPKLDALVPRAPDRLQTCLHQAQDDPEAAIKTAGDWLSEAKGDAKTFPYECLGSALGKVGSWQEAEYAFLQGRSVLNAAETMRRARLAAMAGNAAMADERYDAALASLDLARADAAQGNDPTFSGGIEVDRARALANLKRLPEAGQALAAARQQAPKNPETWLLSATLARREGRLEDAQGYIEKAAELRPIDLEIGLEAGVIAMLSGHEDAARKSWKSVVDADPASPEGQTAQSYLAQLDKP